MIGTEFPNGMTEEQWRNLRYSVNSVAVDQELQEVVSDAATRLRENLQSRGLMDLVDSVVLEQILAEIEEEIY